MAFVFTHFGLDRALIPEHDVHVLLRLLLDDVLHGVFVAHAQVREMLQHEPALLQPNRTVAATHAKNGVTFNSAKMYTTKMYIT